MALKSKFKANSKSFVRRWYEEPEILHNTESVEAVVASFPITRMDSVVILPFMPTIGETATVQIYVSYDEPQYTSGGMFDSDEDVDPTDLMDPNSDGTFHWRKYEDAKSITSTDALDTNKTVISQFNTGISAIQIRAKSDVAGKTLKVYVRGYHIER